MFEKPYAMPRVLKLVDIRPHFGLPRLIVSSARSAGGATGVKADGGDFGHKCPGQLNENAANLLDLFSFVEQVFVTQQVAESQLASLSLCLGTGEKWSILCPQLLS
jgi:hypothetical protein